MACLDVQCTIDGCKEYVHGHDIERAYDLSEDGSEVQVGYIVYYLCDADHKFAIIVDLSGSPDGFLPDLKETA